MNMIPTFIILNSSRLTRRLVLHKAFATNVEPHFHTTTKVKAELDSTVKEQFFQEKYKPRRHPGVSKCKIASLPPDITKAIHAVLEDGEYKSLKEESINLGNYLHSRLPPPEQHEIDSKARTIYNKLSKRSVNPNLTDIEREKKVHEEKVRFFNVLKKNVYSWANIVYNEKVGLQYLMVRTPAEYAVLLRVFDEIQRAIPDYKPRSFFDFGSGVGSGIWAVNHYWRDSIFEYFCVDTSREMLDIARVILCGGRENAEITLRGFFQRQFLPASSKFTYSIVLSAYTLFEIPSRKERLQTIQKLWNKTEDFLIVVEQGTNAGFKLVNEVREFVLDISKEKNKGYVFAPCPNDNVCPRYLEHETPCNFLMKYTPPPFLDKSNPKSELFTYVILRKGKRLEHDRQWPRIVRAPIVRARHAICRMCTSQGELKEVIFTKRKHDQNTYRCARSSCWGDQLPVQLEYERVNERDIVEYNLSGDDVSSLGNEEHCLNCNDK